MYDFAQINKCWFRLGAKGAARQVEGASEQECTLPAGHALFTASVRVGQARCTLVFPLLDWPRVLALVWAEEAKI